MALHDYRKKKAASSSKGENRGAPSAGKKISPKKKEPPIILEGKVKKAVKTAWSEKEDWLKFFTQPNKGAMGEYLGGALTDKKDFKEKGRLGMETNVPFTYKKGR